MTNIVCNQNTISVGIIEGLLQNDTFERDGITMHSGRNIVKRFSCDNTDIVIKKYGKITLFNRIMYATIRKNKAERSYHNALRLKELGINTPEVIAYHNEKKGFLLTSCSLVTHFSAWQSMDKMKDYHYGDTEKEPLLEAMTEWIVTLHEKGIEHKDLNLSNILYQKTTDGRFEFQMIDINRMRFWKKMTTKKRLRNLRRLSGNTDLTGFVLRNYARIAKLDLDKTVIWGFHYKTQFELQKNFKRSIKRRFS